MSKLQKTLCVIISLALIFTSALVVSADSKQVKKFDLTMSKTSAIEGDTVVLSLDIKNNPGIMAVTFTVHFDPQVLEFDSYVGGLFNRDTSKLHENYFSVVCLARRDIKADGTMYGFKFKVKESAKAGFSPVTVKNIHPEQFGDSLNGCFANWKGDKLVPNFTAGGVDVGYNEHNHTHEYGEWKNVVEPTCDKIGVDERICIYCGANEQREIKAIGHKFDENWTIDHIATASKDGTMSRHCKNKACKKTADSVKFTEYDAEKNGFKNEVGTVLAPGSWEHLEENKNESETEPDTGNTSENSKPVNPDDKNEITPNNDSETGSNSNNSNDVDSLPSENENSENNSSNSDSLLDEDDNDSNTETKSENDFIDADSLIENSGDKKSPFSKRLHTYIYGSEETFGLIDYIYNLANREKFDLLKMVAKIILVIFNF